ncbi:MAG: efflux RND transporter periplasmic adaptor subunit [Candidatus Riflebacteria bacterium]|nr:efflux RND transporter periplasmic adaptor subunit [Candidatus Riflebacteria bacterium]
MNTHFIRVRITFLSFISAFSMIFTPFCTAASAASPDDAVTASAAVSATNEPKNTDESINLAVGELIGEVLPMRKAALATKVSGRLVFVPLFSGESAASGTIIATIDPRDFELAVEQSQAALEAARVRLKQLETGFRPEERRSAAETLKQALANRDNAQADYLRMRDLCKAGAVSQQTLDAAEARAKVNEAQYIAAREQKSLVDQGPRLEEKDGARATVRQMEATLDLARLQLEFASIKAPFDGVISQRMLDEGAYVTSSNPVYTIMQIDPVIVAVDCPERFVPSLSTGLKAVISLDALPGRSFFGTLDRLPAFLDSKTRAARIEITVPNPEKILKPGMFARVRISLPGEKAPVK